MKVKLMIKEGCHSPSFFSKLKYFRFWLFKVPKIVKISNVKITYSSDNRIKSLIIRQNDPFDYGVKKALVTQINKIGGIAYGLPKYSKEYKSWIHPNSDRLGFQLRKAEGLENHYNNGQIFCQYSYTESIRYGFCFTRPEYDLDGNYIGFKEMSITSKQRKSSSHWFAYSLLPYFGGKYPAPCDITIEYDVEYE